MDHWLDGGTEHRLQSWLSATGETAGRIPAAKLHRETNSSRKRLRAPHSIHGVFASRILLGLCVALVAPPSLRTALAEDVAVVHSSRAQTVAGSIASGFASVAACIANCAINPIPDYNTCVANCWTSSESLVINILRALVAPSESTEIDPEVLVRALKTITQIEKALDSQSDSRLLLDSLRELFAQDWGNGLFRLCIDVYFLGASKELAGSRLLNQTAERENEVIEMLLSVAWDERIMIQASHAGRAGVFAMLPVDSEGIQALLEDWGVSQADLRIADLVDTILDPPISLSGGILPGSVRNTQLGKQGVFRFFIGQFAK